jgi:hypothetical protein
MNHIVTVMMSLVLHLRPWIDDHDWTTYHFSQEDCIDTLFPKTNKYKERLARYQGKDPGSVKILKKDADMRDQE